MEKPGAGEEDHKMPRMGRRLSKKKSRGRASFKLRSDSLNCLRLRRVFDLFDKNGDGFITVDEIRQALVLLGLEEDDNDHDHDDNHDIHVLQGKDEIDGSDHGDLDSIVASFIKPGNHGLAFEDFEALHDSLSANTAFFDCIDEEEDSKTTTVMDDREQQVESDLSEAFKVFDSNGDGFISALELQQVLSKLGFPEAQQQLPNIQLMISSFDHNHDGRVDFFEFKHMMSRSLLDSFSF